MHSSVFILLSLISLESMWSNYSPSIPLEICNNALDDDGDGLIDHNDDDCFCQEIEPVPASLIPNPSFEDQECCPDGPSELFCASGWNQASAGTTDYYHICGNSGQDIFDIPLPLPEGEGFVGFFDGFFPTNGDPLPNTKEYAGACLNDPLKTETIYRIQFHIGFLDRDQSPATDIAIFGSIDCNNLPFGGEDRSFGCPTNGSGWIRLGAVPVFGQNEWKKFEITFESNTEINAIVIGPDCAARTFPRSPYYFMDNLILSEDRNFEIGIAASDQPCSNDFTLDFSLEGTFNYQWYKDGIAILGATDPSLTNLPDAGEYQIRVENEAGCKISESFNYFPPFASVRIEHTICPEDTYLFDNNELTQAGIYFDTLKRGDHCDSIIRLDLQVDDNIESFISAKIFPSETYKIDNQNFNLPGQYNSTIPSMNGCDSIVHLDLDYYHVYLPNSFSPNRDNINDQFIISGDEDLVSVTSLNIYNRWGGVVYSGVSLLPGEGWDGRTNGVDASEGVYIYVANVLMEDDIKRSLYGDVVLIR